MSSNKTSQAGDFASEAHRLIDQIGKNNQLYEQSCIAFFGVTSSQGGTLLSLPPNGNLKMNELSSAMKVDTSTMTRMVDQLVDKGLVIRTTGDKDRRLVYVGLTRSGQKLQHELANALEKFYEDSLYQIPENDRKEILVSLNLINDAIKKGLEECCKKYCQPQSSKEQGNGT